MAQVTTPEKTTYQWTQLQNAPWASSRTDDIWFFDEKVGWLVNSSGYVAKTVDGGNYWEDKYFVYPGGVGRPYLRCMSWGSRKVGWFGAVTGLSDKEWYAEFDRGQGPYDPKHHTDYTLPEKYRNTLLHQTNDGGETWRPVTNLPAASPAGICGFHAVNEKVAYGSGTNDPGLPGPAVIKTVDGGANWELIPMFEYADNLIDIFFFDEDFGFVVGGKIDPKCPAAGNPYYPPPRLIRYGQVKPVVLRTTDGGKTWENVAKARDTKGLRGGDYPCGEWGWKIQFLDRRHGFVSLENFRDSSILKTTDGGNTWERKHVALSQDPDAPPINNDLEGIGFINPKQGWVGGWGDNFNGWQNSYTEDGGETWTAQDYVPGDPSSDPRFRINRYRFVGSPAVGYCSGQTIFKLDAGRGNGKKKAGLEAAPSPRVEPHGLGPHGGTMHGQSAAPAASMQRQSEPAPAGHGFRIAHAVADGGRVEISYDLPADSDKVFVGLWNQFAFHVRTLIENVSQNKGRQTLVWDGKDDHGEPLSRGVYIVRLATDRVTGASHTIRLGC